MNDRDNLLVQKRDSQEDLESLVSWFRRFRSCIVAFSGGVDSSLLGYAAKQALKNNAFLVISKSPAFADSEGDFARKIATEIGIKLIEVVQDDLADQNYVKNEVMRCYFCRSNLANVIRPIAEELLIDVRVEGTHVDDIQTPRPGIKALREAGFRAPLLELHIGKERIREAAKSAGLSNWDRPSEACLSSRIAFGQKIDKRILSRIEAAENIVKLATSARIVRVRTIGNHAIVEVENDSVRTALAKSQSICEGLNALGYESVEISKEGYKSGKMLELFVKNESER
ncbi:MAG: ATP-dependent sacrificial sulfur transferase LarE [Thaumarchaeota archaeon]|nr:ATP-dependent sacrificial sulfur transferase LarE [Nitrososphaerota archaeon]